MRPRTGPFRTIAQALACASAPLLVSCFISYAHGQRELMV
jgi:hypothetical protein